MGFSLKITDNNKTAVIDALDEGVQRALEAIGMQCENYAKLKCPVDTGLLRNSITHVVSGGSVSKMYHASKGSNVNKKGQKISAGSKNAGSVKVGFISGSIGSKDEPAVYVGTNVEYAAYVEVGTDRTDRFEPQPYIRPAVMDHINEYKQIAKEAMNW